MTTVTNETIVQNLKEFSTELHDPAQDAMIDSLLEKDEETFALANTIHNISHALIDILQGKSANEAISKVFVEDETDEEDGEFVGQITLNVKTGEIQGVVDIKDPELKQKIAAVAKEIAVSSEMYKVNYLR